MLLVADVHGAADALRRVASLGEPLLVLGDLVNYIDYRSNEGIVADISGQHVVDEFVRIRAADGNVAASAFWQVEWTDRAADLEDRYDEAIEAQYRNVCAALRGSRAYVTYGNVDRPDMLAANLPSGTRFVDAEVVEIDGLRIGFAGGGLVSIGTPGEVTETEMEAKLAQVGSIDILATHVPPAIPALACDVIGGRAKGSNAILEFLERERPAYHYFGDIHQPRATTWHVGPTTCVNVGYFRATGRPVRHG